jgi:hypothetical protein
MKKDKDKLKKKTNKIKKIAKRPKVQWDNDRKMSGSVGNLAFSWDPENQFEFLQEQAEIAGY